MLIMKNIEPLKKSVVPQASATIHQRGLFNARDGTSIYYEVQGEGRPLIFCYGLVCRKEHWHHQIDYFSRKYQVITFDYRGHQSSSKPSNDTHLTLDWCARDIQDLMAHLKLTEAVCLGHSMGVPVLTHLARFEPERIKAAVFVCGAVTNPFENMFYSNRLNRVYKAAAKLYDFAPGFMNLVWQKFTEHNRLNYFLTSRLGFNASKAEEKDVLLYMEGVHQTPFSTFQSLMNDYTNFDGTKQLPHIQCPVLVIAGEDDYITPVLLQQEIAKLIPKGELVEIPDGSHNAHMDFPERVNGTINEFLQRVDFV